MKKKIILGVTGGFGSGKTTAAKIFASLGAKVIDADKIAHRCIMPGTSAYRKIVSAFGKGILNKTKTINRRKLAKIVFSNRGLLKKLNNIVHPETIRIIKDKIKTLKSKVIILDAPLLLEAGLGEIVDKLIVVRSRRQLQIKRIQAREPLSTAEVIKRIKSQVPLAKKEIWADFVIDDSSTVKKTREQVKEIWRKLKLARN